MANETESLTERELEVLQLVATGASNRQVAQEHFHLSFLVATVIILNKQKFVNWREGQSPSESAPTV